MNAIEEIGSKKTNLVGYLNNCLNEKLLNDRENNLRVRGIILNEMKNLEAFASNLKDKTDFPVEKVWIGRKLIITLNNLKTELNIYRNERRQDAKVDAEGNLNYKGYFSKLSHLKEMFLNNENIEEVKIINVFSTHSFTFDVNFEIRKSIYKTDP